MLIKHCDKNTTLSVKTLHPFMLGVIFLVMPIVIMMIVGMLSVIMLNVFKLIVAAPFSGDL